MQTKATLLESNRPLTVTLSGDRMAIDLDAVHFTELISTISWVVKLEYLGNDSRDPLRELAARNITPDSSRLRRTPPVLL